MPGCARPGAEGLVPGQTASFGDLSAHALPPTHTSVGIGLTGGERRALPSPRPPPQAHGWLLAPSLMEAVIRDVDGSKAEVHRSWMCSWGHLWVATKVRAGPDAAKDPPKKPQGISRPRETSPLEDPLLSLGRCCQPPVFSREAASPVPGAAGAAPSAAGRAWHSQMAPGKHGTAGWFQVSMARPDGSGRAWHGWMAPGEREEEETRAKSRASTAHSSSLLLGEE